MGFLLIFGDFGFTLSTLVDFSNWGLLIGGVGDRTRLSFGGGLLDLERFLERLGDLLLSFFAVLTGVSDCFFVGTSSTFLLSGLLVRLIGLVR